MDQKALPVCHLKLLFILFYYHSEIDLRGGKRRREKITRLKKQRTKEGMAVLACFGSTLTPQHYIRPFKSTSEPAAETRNPEENTQPVCPQYIVQGERERWPLHLHSCTTP